MPRDIALLASGIVAASSAGLSYVFSFVSAHHAVRFGAIDKPTGGRKIHAEPIPLLGGAGIVCALLIAMAAGSRLGLLPGISPRQLIGFAVALVILVIGGALDDLRPQPALRQLIFPILAAVAVIVSGTGIVQVTSLSGPNGFSLVWWKSSSLSLPADLLTLLWLLFATYATKLLDGLDGLVAGIAVIGSSMVGALTLSIAYFQPGVAALAAAVGGSFMGFLPRNAHPAKQFLGEAGSTMAGFSLGFLAIVSSAKVAIALSVLAIPLADAVFVVVGRLRRGLPPWKGDATHLHFRLLDAGISHRTAVVLLWAASFAAGVAALTLQTRGKLFLVGSLVVLTGLLSWVMNRRRV
ncbi:undecaprenyl/decaprenyl-phosphate alpha-N-acetylglucosaminyl 1-phosphate transferase [Candidatus Uhrbacteria bacterium]|nr:undecaprenyl/decaprenyl-phosphate alpha-N-acetylglucosaminyl 1-phosphate transferase [Candidatus Uhrbacteria bacterium]